MKKVLSIAACICFMLSLSGIAEACYTDKCGPKTLSGRFYNNYKLLMRNADQVGLDDTQKSSLKELKYGMKKDNIKTKAEIKVLKIDLAEALREDVKDQAAINAMIDEKYQLKARMKKDQIGALAAMDELLTDDQQNELRTLRKEKRSYKKSKAYRKKAADRMHKQN